MLASSTLISSVDNQQHFVRTPLASELAEIHKPSVNGVEWIRNTLHLNQAAKTLVEQEFSFEVKGKVVEIERALEAKFRVDAPGCKALLNDLVNVLRQFEKVTGTSGFKLRLSTVNTNMCRRFHTDMNEIRLLCTYLGQGTLWIPEQALNRKALLNSTDETGMIQSPDAIQQTEPGNVLLMKGALYPHEQTRALVHRSPTIEESGEKRLLLRIDTPSFFAFEL